MYEGKLEIVVNVTKGTYSYRQLLNGIKVCLTIICFKKNICSHPVFQHPLYNNYVGTISMNRHSIVKQCNKNI